MRHMDEQNQSPAAVRAVSGTVHAPSAPATGGPATSRASSAMSSGS